MGYVSDWPGERALGCPGCGGTCRGGRRSAPRRTLGEWYVREGPEDDGDDEGERRSPPGQPSGGSRAEFGEATAPSGVSRGPSARPQCRFRIADSVTIEREPARRMLALSAEVARRFIRTVGAVGARGRFVPTVVDNKYWFAKLYEFITYEEIAATPAFRHPAFVLHFIPPFYALYLQALDNFLQGRSSAVSAIWTNHFTRAARPDTSSIRAWMTGVRASITTGVAAHVQGDMAVALERTYRSYVGKYCLSPTPPLDEFRPDFFDRNRIVFERAQASFLLHLSQFGPFPVGPEWGQFLFAQGQAAIGALNVDEVYRWRDQAWRAARARLGQGP